MKVIKKMNFKKSNLEKDQPSTSTPSVPHESFRVIIRKKIIVEGLE